MSDAAPTGQGNLIDRNAANANGSDGILVAGTGHTVVANSAYMNAGWGMYAEPGNTDGGGNLAAGNEEPEQCFNIVCDPGGFVVPGLPDTTILEHPEDPSAQPQRELHVHRLRRHDAAGRPRASSAGWTRAPRRTGPTARTRRSTRA